jgi:hypothetical protein
MAPQAPPPQAEAGAGQGARNPHADLKAWRLLRRRVADDLPSP